MNKMMFLCKLQARELKKNGVKRRIKEIKIMIEYKGYKLFVIDYGERDYIVSKTMQDALNYFFSNVGEEYDDEEGISVNVVEKDFMVNQDEIDEPNEMASIIMQKDIDTEIEKIPYLLASSIY